MDPVSVAILVVTLGLAGVVGARVAVDPATYRARPEPCYAVPVGRGGVDCYDAAGKFLRHYAPLRWQP